MGVVYDNIYTYSTVLILSAFWVKYTIDYLGDLIYELRLYIKIIIFMGKVCLIENSGSDFLFKKFPDDLCG